jgi:adenine-specific DNA-methyltransferase
MKRARASEIDPATPVIDVENCVAHRRVPDAAHCATPCLPSRSARERTSWTAALSAWRPRRVGTPAYASMGDPVMFSYNSVYQADCRSVLKSFPSNSFDLVLTDPPYFVNYRDRFGRTVANDCDELGILSAFDEVYRVLKPNTVCISFYGWSRIDAFFAAWRHAGFRVAGHIVWCKGYPSRVGMLRLRHEQAYLLAKGRPAQPRKPLDDVQPWAYSGNRHHPTEKSVAILRPLIECFSPRGGAVFDPFAGSGSSLLAAALTGRRYCGVELGTEHCATIRERLSRAGVPSSATTNPIDLEDSLEEYSRWLAARGWALPPSVLSRSSATGLAEIAPMHDGGGP